MILINLNLTASAMSNEEINSQLTLAALEGNLAKAEQLLKDGADVNSKSKDVNGAKPLLCSASMNKLKMVRFFLSKGADINATTIHGKTALFIATQQGYTEIAVAFLVFVYRLVC